MLGKVAHCAAILPTSYRYISILHCFPSLILTNSLHSFCLPSCLHWFVYTDFVLFLKPNLCSIEGKDLIVRFFQILCTRAPTQVLLIFLSLYIRSSFLLFFSLPIFVIFLFQYEFNFLIHFCFRLNLFAILPDLTFPVLRFLALCSSTAIILIWGDSCCLGLYYIIIIIIITNIKTLSLNILFVLAERRAQLNRSRSRGPAGHGSPLAKEIM